MGSDEELQDRDDEEEPYVPVNLLMPDRAGFQTVFKWGTAVLAILWLLPLGYEFWSWRELGTDEWIIVGFTVLLLLTAPVYIALRGKPLAQGKDRVKVVAAIVVGSQLKHAPESAVWLAGVVNGIFLCVALLFDDALKKLDGEL